MNTEQLAPSHDVQDQPGLVVPDVAHLDPGVIVEPKPFNYERTDEVRQFDARSVISGIKKWFKAKTGVGQIPGPSASELLAEHEAALNNPEAHQSTLAERHPDWPKLEMLALYGGHDDDEKSRDFDMLADTFEEYKPDVYLHEAASGEGYIRGRSKSTRALQKVASKYGDGLTQASLEGMGRAPSAQYRALDRTGIIVGTTDLTRQENGELGIDAAFGRAETRPPDPDLDGELDRIRESARENADAQTGRDVVNVKRFEHEMERIFKAHPELLAKDTVRIVQTFGAYHTQQWHGLVKDGVNLKVRFQGSSLEGGPDRDANPHYVYDYNNQVARMLSFGKEPSRELLQKAYLTNMVGAALGEVHTANTYDQTDFVRRTVDALPVEDTAELHERIVQGIAPEDMRKVIDQKLIQRGREPLPAGTDELNGQLIALRKLQPRPKTTVR
jgi:hypothetical protein